jgi:DNA-binding LacI/PurR family transcriptional regulator
MVLLTIAEVAEFLKISKSTVRRYNNNDAFLSLK